jgi:hypothetical protein
LSRADPAVKRDQHVPKIIETLAAPYQSRRSLLPLQRWNDSG